MMARPAAVMAYTCQPTWVSSGSCAMKIRMASAFTNPVTTERETKRIRAPSLSRPAPICSIPVSKVATSRYCRPWSLTSVTITSAMAPVAAEIMPGRPPAKAMTTAMLNEAYSPTLGSTPAMMEKAMASGMSASATTRPASTSPRILESQVFLIEERVIGNAARRAMRSGGTDWKGNGQPAGQRTGRWSCKGNVRPGKGGSDGEPRYGGVTALKYPRGSALPRTCAGVCKALRWKWCIAILYGERALRRLAWVGRTWPMRGKAWVRNALVQHGRQCFHESWLFPSSGCCFRVGMGGRMGVRGAGGACGRGVCPGRHRAARACLHPVPRQGGPGYVGRLFSAHCGKACGLPDQPVAPLSRWTAQLPAHDPSHRTSHR